MKISSFEQPDRIDLSISLPMLEKGFEKNPKSTEIILRLADINLELNKFQVAQFYIDKYLVLLNFSDHALMQIVNFYIKAQQFNQALLILDKLSDNVSESVIYLFKKAHILLELKHYKEANELCEQILRIKPNHKQVLLTQAKLDFIANHFSVAKTKCERILIQKPKNIIANNLLNSCDFHLTLQKDYFENQFKQLIKIYSVSAKETLSDSIKNFNKRINEIIDSSNYWIQNPSQYPIQKGEELNDLFSYRFKKYKAIQQLEKIIHSKVIQYLIEMCALDIDYFKDYPDVLSLNGWAVKLKKGGYNEPHIHPQGWISGVYYSKVPNFSGVELAGSLELGVLLPNTKFQPIKSIKVKEGMFILFPSYYSHRTVPFHSEETRISIAFDTYAFDENSSI